MQLTCWLLFRTLLFTWLKVNSQVMLGREERKGQARREIRLNGRGWEGKKHKFEKTQNSADNFF